MSQLEQRVSELRFIDGIEKVEHVQFPTGDQFWVRFNQPLDMEKLHRTVRNRGCRLIKFGGLMSKFPRRLSELLWDGVTHVIVKQISAWERFVSSLGFEPYGIGKIARDLHGPHQIFMAMNEEGVQLLYDYLGVKYVPPPPPPKPVLSPAAKPPSAPAKPAAITPPRPVGQVDATSPPGVTKPPPIVEHSSSAEEKAAT